jgi:EpsI family protein
MNRAASRLGLSRRAALAGVAMGSVAIAAAWTRPTASAAAEPQPTLDDIFPARFGSWRLDPGGAAFVRAAEQQGKLYGVYDQVLERVFVDDNGRSVMLSVAYGKEQSARLQMHRPEVCYRASGFAVTSLARLHLPMADRTIAVTRLFAEKAGRPEPITYWTVLGRKIVEDATAFRWSQLRDGLRGQVSDGLLVRVSTVQRDLPRAYVEQARFADALVRAIDPRYRSRVIGA